MKQKFVLIFSLILFSLHLKADDSAIEILKATDKARGGVESGLAWKSQVTTFEDGEKNLREFTIKAKGVDALVTAEAPLRTKGEIYVFNDRNMWFFKPSLKKPVSISSRAKLSGLASNGDIASTWYARDYEPKIEKTEELSGEKHWVLFLKAKNSSTTYDQIRYWVSQKTRLASKADFLTLQGQILKSATFKYGNKLKVEGKVIPFISEMQIQDAKRKDFKSLIKYISLKTESFKTGEFNINNVRK